VGHVGPILTDALTDAMLNGRGSDWNGVDIKKAGGFLTTVTEFRQNSGPLNGY
jgi:hypothetical protein